MCAFIFSPEECYRARRPEYIIPKTSVAAKEIAAGLQASQAVRGGVQEEAGGGVDRETEAGVRS